jgi:hypothetical protein
VALVMKGLKARRWVVVTGLLNRIMAMSGRLSPTPGSLRISNWFRSSPK